MLKQQPVEEKKYIFVWSSCSLIASQSLINEAWHFRSDKSRYKNFQPLFYLTCTDSCTSAPRPGGQLNSELNGGEKEEKWRLPVACTSFARRLALQDWCPWPAWWTFSWLWRWWWPPLWRAPWCSPAKCEGAQLTRGKDRNEIRTRARGKGTCLFSWFFTSFSISILIRSRHIKKKNFHFFFHPEQMVISSWNV